MESGDSKYVDIGPGMKAQVTTIKVAGRRNVEAACNGLIAASQWFSVTPLPDDEWEVSVKVGDASPQPWHQ